MADSNNQPSDKVVARMQLNGHAIDRIGYRSTATYFLRLPDGHPAGSGFPQTGYQSLERLSTGAIGTLAAVDGSTVYHGWTDLTATVRAILDYERGRARSVQLNVAETNASLNPDDHSDHRMTAKAALEAARDLGCARRVYYVEYASARLPENLPVRERELESSVLAVTAAGVLALDHASLWSPYLRSYLGRNYFRVEDGAGHCSGPVSGAVHAVSGQPTNSPGKQ